MSGFTSETTAVSPALQATIADNMNVNADQPRVVSLHEAPQQVEPSTKGIRLEDLQVRVYQKNEKKRNKY